MSKIRFLESQGLITPERTPSGYRQFSEGDLALLRWILRQQRDHYLPLKVIRRRLKEGDGPGREVEVPIEAGQRTAASASAVTAAAAPAAARAAAAPVAVDEARLPCPIRPPSSPTRTPYGRSRRRAGSGTVAPPGAGPDGRRAGPAGARPATAATTSASRPASTSGRGRAGVLRPAPGGRRRRGTARGPAASPRSPPASSRYGVEARHLRMYKTSAEREAAFLSRS